MTVKNIVFGAGLVTALATSGSQVGAQSTAPRAETRIRPNVMVLDGRGSQLGVMVEDTANGVRIGEVNSGSAAEKAGVKEGDIVVDFDGERVRSAKQLTRLIQETPEGKSVKMTVTRDGKKQTLDATPDQRSGDFSWNMNWDGDQIRREFERGMQGFRTMPAPPAFSYRFDDRIPGLLENFTMARGGRLGVTVQTLSDQLQEYFGAKEGGALVSSVAKESAAEKAGLKAGDVIVSINGDKVRDAEELTSEIGDKSGEITIGILRDKKASTLKATIESRATRPRTTTPRRGLQPAVMVRPA